MCRTFFTSKRLRPDLEVPRGGGATPRFWTPTTPPTNCRPEAPWGGGGGGGTQQSVDCESLTPTQGATQQSVDCESLTPTRGVTQQSVDSKLVPVSSIAPEGWVPKEGGNATSPLHSRGSPTKGTKSEVKTYARGHHDAPSISKYGSLVQPDAQIAAGYAPP